MGCNVVCMLGWPMVSYNLVQPFHYFLITDLEKNQSVFHEHMISGEADTVYIMALGAGHCCDPELPANQ